MVNRRTFLTALPVLPIAGCAAVTQLATTEGLMDATGKVRVFQTFLFVGNGVLAVAGALFPGLSALKEAVQAGEAIVAAIQAQGGATVAQVADLDTHTATINALAMTHATVVVNAAGVG